MEQAELAYQQTRDELADFIIAQHPRAGGSRATLMTGFPAQLWIADELEEPHASINDGIGGPPSATCASGSPNHVKLL